MSLLFTSRHRCVEKPAATINHRKPQRFALPNHLRGARHLIFGLLVSSLLTTSADLSILAAQSTNRAANPDSGDEYEAGDLPAPQLDPANRDSNNLRDSQKSLRDPTAPTDRILQQVPPPKPEPVTQQRRNAPATNANAALPQLPSITLRGIAMSKSDRGTAILDVDGKSVSISLIPRNKQTRISIPDTQFLKYRRALKQRAADSIENLQQLDGIESNRPKFEMCLQCSFAHQDLLFNLEAFTSETLLLRAVPLGQLVIVRNQTP